MFYAVKLLTETSPEGKIINRPDIPSGIPYVWSPDHKCNTCGTYILFTSEILTESEDILLIHDISNSCSKRGLLVEEVMLWGIGQTLASDSGV